MGIITGERKSDPNLGPGRLATLKQMLRIYVVERFDHRMSELTLDPAALSQAVLNLLDSSVALLRVVIPGIHNGDILSETKLKPFENRLLGDFEVCPLEPEHKGAMQVACIESARHVVVESEAGSKAVKR
jgi:hypothetical protein